MKYTLFTSNVGRTIKYDPYSSSTGYLKFHLTFDNKISFRAIYHTEYSKDSFHFIHPSILKFSREYIELYYLCCSSSSCVSYKIGATTLLALRISYHNRLLSAKQLNSSVMSFPNRSVIFHLDNEAIEIKIHLFSFNDQLSVFTRTEDWIVIK